MCSDSPMGIGFLFLVLKCPKIDYDDGCISLNILKPTELYTLKG